MNAPNRLLIRLALGTLTALAAAAQTPASALAQETPGVYHACYVPVSGTVYRIKTPETRPTCASASHVEFSWNQEGQQGPPGPPGVFSGAFSSPNGQFSLSITDTGIELRGPSGLVRLSTGGIEVLGGSAPVLISASSVLVQADDDVRFEAASDLIMGASRDILLAADRELRGTASGPLQLAGASSQILLTDTGAELRSPSRVRLIGSVVHLNGACNVVAPTVLAC